MKLFLAKVVAGILSLTMLVGCGTIMGKSAAETLNIRSAPDQATVIVLDESGTKIFEGKTPTVISLEKKKGYFRGWESGTYMKV